MASLLLQRTSKYILTVFATLVLTVGIPSCIGSCPEIEEYFDITRIDINNYRIVSTVEDEILTQDNVDFEDYFIKCDFTVEYYSYYTPKTSLMNTAFALSCPSLGESGSLEGMDTILVIAKTDYDNTFSAGDTLSSIVNINTHTYSRKRFEPLSQFITENKSKIWYQHGFDIQLNRKPTNLNTSHSFDVIIKLGNGEEYSSTTPKVYFR